MPIRGAVFADAIAPWLRRAWDGIEPDAWLDVHTHIGANDPDGARATADEIVAGLDAAGHARALVFAMHEPEGYGEANDAVLAACAGARARLQALCRVDPNRPGAAGEARRCLAAGARGIKLHPRSDAFALSHPVVAELVELAARERRPVLFHAGRGIPNLGADAARLAREHPGARVILAHAGISDLGLLGPAAAELDNLFFDTSWWHVSDVLALMTSVPPGRILYASDMPYGPGILSAVIFMRTARQAGLSDEQIEVIAGEQARRILAGEPTLDLGPAPGEAALGVRAVALERVMAHTGAAIQVAFRGGDPAEALALARLSCQRVAGAADGTLLGLLEALLEMAGDQRAAAGGDAMAIVPATLAAHVVSGTAGVETPELAV
jgi:predicted TIM-barrel fold metal-dependent hydrolase